MKKLLLIALLLFVSFVGYSQGSFAIFDISIPFGTTGKAIVKFTNGTTEVGVIKDYRTSFSPRYADPLDIKFKGDTDNEYRFIPSDEILSIRVYEKRDENKFKDYYPIRVRRFDKNYTFSDQYYVSFYPKINYKGIDFVTSPVVLNYKYFGNTYSFSVGNEGYYFDLDNGKSKKKAAQLMMLLDENCEAFQEYVKHNYLETNNYKADYKAAVKKFRQNKKVFINERKKEGYKIRYAKMMFESEEYHIYFKQLIDKYVDLCPKEGN